MENQSGKSEFMAFYKLLVNRYLLAANKYPVTEGQSSHLWKRDHAVRYVILKEIILLLFVNSFGKDFVKDQQIEYEKVLDVEDTLIMMLVKLYRYLSVNEIGKKAKEEVLIPFGLKEDQLCSKTKESLSMEQLELIKESVQNFVNALFCQITAFCVTDELYSSETESVEGITNLVLKRRRSVTSKRVMLAKQRRCNINLLNMVFQQLVEYKNKLEKQLESCRYSEHPLPHLNFLLFSMQTYLHKLRYLNLEVLTATYTKNSVPMLKSLLQNIEKTILEGKQSLFEVESRLAAYEKLPSNFHTLLRQYTTLKKDINHIKM